MKVVARQPRHAQDCSIHEGRRPSFGCHSPVILPPSDQNRARHTCVAFAFSHWISWCELCCINTFSSAFGAAVIRTPANPVTCKILYVKGKDPPADVIPQVCNLQEICNSVVCNKPYKRFPSGVTYERSWPRTQFSKLLTLVSYGTKVVARQPRHAQDRCAHEGRRPNLRCRPCGASSLKRGK